MISSLYIFAFDIMANGFFLLLGSNEVGTCKLWKEKLRIKKSPKLLIHEDDPHVFAQVVRPSIPTFQNKNKSQAKTMLATGGTVHLAEWIIDDSLTPELSFLLLLLSQVVPF